MFSLFAEWHMFKNWTFWNCSNCDQNHPPGTCVEMEILVIIYKYKVPSLFSVSGNNFVYIPVTLRILIILSFSISFFSLKNLSPIPIKYFSLLYHKDWICTIYIKSPFTLKWKDPLVSICIWLWGSIYTNKTVVLVENFSVITNTFQVWMICQQNLS